MEKISFDMIMNTIDGDNNTNKMVWNGIEIEVRRFLTMKEMLEFTDAVVKMCFSDDGTYRPEIRDFIVRTNILSSYTNIETPENLEILYDMVYRCDIIPQVMRYVDRTQFNAIMSAIDCKIEDKLNTNVERYEREVEQKMILIDCAIEEFIDRFNSIFDGIDNDTVRNIAGAISNMSIDPAVLAKSIVEAKEEVKHRDDGIVQ